MLQAVKTMRSTRGGEDIFLLIRHFSLSDVVARAFAALVFLMDELNSLLIEDKYMAKNVAFSSYLVIQLMFCSRLPRYIYRFHLNGP